MSELILTDGPVAGVEPWTIPNASPFPEAVAGIIRGGRCVLAGRCGDGSVAVREWPTEADDRDWLVYRRVGERRGATPEGLYALDAEARQPVRACIGVHAVASLFREAQRMSNAADVLPFILGTLGQALADLLEIVDRPETNVGGTDR